MSKKINWGILGFARIARNSVIPAIMRAKNADFYAIASRDKEKAKECQNTFGCKKTYYSYDELLEDPNIDAVYIPLPNKLHKEWAIKAAKKGKHILCEKPIALNKQECLEMISASKENNVKLMEAFMYRYSTRTKKLAEILETKAIGDIKHINSTFRFLLDRPGDVRLIPELGGGSLYDVGCYPINFVGMLLGKTPISMDSEKVMKNGIDMNFSAVLKYDNGAIATINSGFDSFKVVHSTIVGTSGVINIPSTFLDSDEKITVETKDGIIEYDVEPGLRYVAEIEDFSDAILNNRDPLFSIEESLRNIEILEKLMGQP